MVCGRGGLRVVRPVPAADNLQRLAVPALGLAVVPPLELDRAEVDEVVRHVRMPRPVQSAVDGQDPLVQRVRLAVLARVELAVGELGEALREVGLGLRTARLEPDRLLQHLDGLGVLASVLQDLPQRGGGARDLRVVGGAMAAEHRQTRPRALLGQVVLSPGAGEACPGDERPPHLGVVLAERAAPQRRARGRAAPAPGPGGPARARCRRASGAARPPPRARTRATAPRAHHGPGDPPPAARPPDRPPRSRPRTARA